MKKLIEYELVLENTRLKEDIGIESLEYAKCTFNIYDIVYYRESLGDGGVTEPYTVVGLIADIVLCLNVPYVEFSSMYNNTMEKDLI